MAQAFLHQREHLGIVARLGVEHAIGREPRLVEAGREQVAPPHHPQDRPPGARGDAGEEERGRGVVAQRWRGGGDLVQRVEPQPTVGEPLVDRRHTERQHRATAMAVSLDRAERIAQGLEDARLGHRDDSLVECRS